MLYVGRKKVVHTLLFLQAMVETCNKILVQFIMQRSGRKKENNKKKISSAKQRLITDIVLGRDSPATISAKTFAFSRKCFINFILPFLVSFFSPGDDGVQCIKILRTQKWGRGEEKDCHVFGKGVEKLIRTRGAIAPILWVGERGGGRSRGRKSSREEEELLLTGRKKGL